MERVIFKEDKKEFLIAPMPNGFVAVVVPDEVFCVFDRSGSITAIEDSIADLRYSKYGSDWYIHLSTGMHIFIGGEHPRGHLSNVQFSDYVQMLEDAGCKKVIGKAVVR